MIEFDRAFEEAVLAQALCDVPYLTKAAKVLGAHHFGSPHLAWVWEVIRDTWDQYRELPTRKLIVARAQDKFDSDEQRAPYLELVRKLFRLEPSAAKASLDELTRFVRTVNAQLTMEAAATALEKGKLDDVYESLHNLSKQDLRAKDYTLVRWIEEFDQRQSERKRRHEHPEDYVKIPTGLKRLDEIIDGIEPGELGLMLATTGQGKSIMLSNLAFEAIRRGHPVVYLALEMPARQIAARQDARWLGLPYNKIKAFNFSPSELREINRKLEKIKPRWEKLLRIVSMPLKSCDVNSIRGVLDDLWQDEKFRPQMLLVDSGDHMKGVGRFDSYRLEQASVYWDLKQLAESDGYAVWSSTHAGREWATATATSEATGESYDKARIADIVCSLNTPSKKTRTTRLAIDEDDGVDLVADLKAKAVGKYLELYLAKYRDGPSKVTIPLDADFSRMVIAEIESGEELDDERIPF